jgi:hypothetical protein
METSVFALKIIYKTVRPGVVGFAGSGCVDCLVLAAVDAVGVVVVVLLLCEPMAPRMMNRATMAAIAEPIFLPRDEPLRLLGVCCGAA